MGQSECPADELGHSGLILFVVVVDCLGLAEDLGPVQLVDLVGEVVFSCIALQCQLQLGHNLLVDSYLHSDVRDWCCIIKPTLYLKDFVGLRVSLHEILDQYNCFDDIRNLEEHALPPHHV